MGFSCLTEMSKLVCPYQGNKVSLESWDIIGVPLDIHLGIFLSISAKMEFSCLIEISKLVCPHQGNKVSLESWDIIGVTLDIHLEKKLRILCIVVFQLKRDFIVSPRSRGWIVHARGTRCRWNRGTSQEFNWIFIMDIFTHPVHSRDLRISSEMDCLVSPRSRSWHVHTW